MSDIDLTPEERAALIVAAQNATDPLAFVKEQAIKHIKAAERIARAQGHQEGFAEARERSAEEAERAVSPDNWVGPGVLRPSDGVRLMGRGIAKNIRALQPKGSESDG